MSNIKISDLLAFTNPASTDVLPIVDLGSDITRKVSIADLLESAGAGSAGAPAFSFDVDKDTGMYRSGTNALSFTTAGNPRLTINSSGNVGIGTASISNISGYAQLVLNDSTGGLIQFEDDGSNVGRIVSTSNSLTLRTAGALLFGTNGSTERMRIDSSGDVIVGGTTTSSTNAAYISQNGIYVSNRTAATNDLWNGKLNGTITSTINADGSATFSGNVTAANISDIRFKENITDANPQLADVTALGSQLKNWDWKDEAPLNEELRAKRFLGLVAQEAGKVCPGLTYTVPRTKQGKELTPEVVVPAVYEDQVVPAVIDEDGNTIEPETTKQVLVTEEQVTPATYEELDDSYKAINHDILVMKLLGAVAELSAKVAALESA